ncbi:MAG: TAXI family TRAP transporter solute-binding subunit [Pseudomonadota bacterium]|nr:TAXI family TRAP transporter solute-binding subunit [Pseudomonadota bacterium]
MRRLFGGPTLWLVCLLTILPAARADEPLVLVTGPKTGTYYAFGKDIAQAAAKAGIRIDVKASEGSIDNIKRLNGSENAALGIVQSDVLGFLSRSKSKESERMASNLRLVFPFYNEEVHVLARKSIKSFAGLQGRKVAIGEEGSGNMLTAINLFSMMNITPAESVKMSPAQGVVAVLKGELDAVVFVGGKPVRLFKNLEDLTLPENRKYATMLEQVHFLPLDNPRMLEEYKPAQISHADYNFVDETVPTIAVQAVLISHDFSQGHSKRRCDRLAALADAIRANLPALKEKGHPKWQEVNLDADSGVWKKDVCAKSSGGEHSGLMKILEKDKAD